MTPARRERVLLVAMATFQVAWLASLAWRSLPGLRATVIAAGAVAVAATLAFVLLPRGRVPCVPRAGLPTILGGALLALATVSSVQAPLVPDEPYLQAAARLVAAQGPGALLRDYPNLPWLARHHPPGVPVLHGLLASALGDSLVALRLLSVACALVMVWATARLGSMLFDRRTGLLAALCLLAMPLFLRTGAAGLNDAPAAAGTALAVLLAVRLWTSSASAGFAALAGIAFGWSMLLKYTALLGLPAIGISILHAGRRRPSLAATFLLSATAIVLPWIVFLWHGEMLGTAAGGVGHHAMQVTATVGGWEWLGTAILWRLPPALGAFNLPLLAAGAAALTSQGGRSARLLGIWIAAPAAVLLLTLPDPRYFLPLFPALALVLARGSQTVAHPERLVICALIQAAATIAVSAGSGRVAALFYR